MACSNWRKFSLALIQLKVGSVKKDNLARAAIKIKEATAQGAQVIALPECFNSPYGTNYFSEYAESIPGETTDFLSQAAMKNEVYLVGGSFPEKYKEGIYNTCTVWGPDGKLLVKHRKMHMFNIDIPGEITFRESSVLFHGNYFSMFDLPSCKVGVGICYDMRFAEMAQIYAAKGCELLIYPGAFNMTTGPPHWELLQRTRALDNQLYVATVSPARDPDASYVAWGHSGIVDPWGTLIAKTEEKEDIVYAEIDLDYAAKVRQMIPLATQRRREIYRTSHLVSE